MTHRFLNNYGVHSLSLSVYLNEIRVTIYATGSAAATDMYTASQSHMCFVAEKTDSL